MTETKVCRTCGEEVPVDNFYPNGSGNPRPDCKPCHRKAQRELNDLRKQRTPEEAITKVEKRCNECKKTLPVSVFGIALVNPDGLKGICKPCESKRSVKWSNSTPERRERALKRDKNWYRKNKDRHIEHAKRWAKNNPEKYAQVQEKALKKYRASEKGRTNIKKLRDEKTASGKLAAYKRKRDALKINATPPWLNLDDLFPIYEEAAWLSAFTGEKYEDDHIEPLRHKLVCGLHIAENLESITKTANRKKLNKFTPYRIDADNNYYELRGEEWELITNWIDLIS